MGCIAKIFSFTHDPLSCSHKFKLKMLRKTFDNWYHVEHLLTMAYYYAIILVHNLLISNMLKKVRTYKSDLSRSLIICSETSIRLLYKNTKVDFVIKILHTLYCVIQIKNQLFYIELRCFLICNNKHLFTISLFGLKLFLNTVVSKNNKSTISYDGTFKIDSQQPIIHLSI